MGAGLRDLCYQVKFLLLLSFKIKHRMESINPDNSSVSSTGKWAPPVLVAAVPPASGRGALLGSALHPSFSFYWEARAAEFGHPTWASYGKSWAFGAEILPPPAAVLGAERPGGVPQLFPGWVSFQGGAEGWQLGAWGLFISKAILHMLTTWAQKANTEAWCKIRTFPWIWAFYKVCCILQCGFITS